MLKDLSRWMDERSGLVQVTKDELFKPLPDGVGWRFCLGSALMFLILVQFVTGVTLATFYAPTPDHAYHSLQYVDQSVPFGRIVRGIHHWSASAIVVVMMLHIIRTLVYAAYKKPRELTWILGVLLFFVIMAFSFTGYLLPWDQKAYWATVVGTKIAGSMPLFGPALMKVLRGSAEVGALTLTRFYAIHVMLLPWLLMILMGLHLYLVRKHGSAGPYHPYRGKVTEPNYFFPNQIWKDFVVFAGLTLFILYMAYRVGAPMEAVANPGDTSYVPRPEWYFLSLYQLLKYLPGPLEVVGTAVIPAAIGLALLLLPFLDRSPERDPLKRRWVIGISTVVLVGSTVLTLVSYTTAQKSPELSASLSSAGLAAGTRIIGDPVRGKAAMDRQGCTGCHKINGSGGEVGPELSHIGSRRDLAYLSKFIVNPKSFHPKTIMPPTQAPPQEINDIAAYLQSLK